MSNPIDQGIADMPIMEWNNRRALAFLDKLRKVQHPEEFPNGLLCVCGGKLYDTGQFIPGHPGRLIVKCLKCNKKDERYE